MMNFLEVFWKIRRKDLSHPKAATASRITSPKES